MKKILLLLSSLFYLTSCSQNNLTPNAESTQIDFIEIFMSRAAFSKAQFEQYKISEGGVFIECGDFYRGRARPDYQEFKKLPSNVLSNIFHRAGFVSESLKNSSVKFEPQGKSNSMFDPGQLTLTIGAGSQKYEVKTSVNAIVNNEAGVELRIKKLIQAVRAGIQSESCGRESFYGIETINE